MLRASGRVVVLYLLVALPLLACGGDSRSPEERIRALVAEAEQAAEAGDLAALKERIAENYQDAAGNDRRALMAYLLIRLREHRTRHLLTRVVHLDLLDASHAEAVVVVGMAGSPVKEPEDFRRMRADMYRVELELAESGGTWRVHSARWRTARARDLL